MIQMTMEAARVNAGLTQNEAGERFGVHYQTVAKWENDNSKMPFDMIRKIPSVYYVAPKFIFFGSKNEYIRLLKENKFEMMATE